MTDISVHSEIERKSQETLVEWLESYSAGRHTLEETKAALAALWGAVAGLISKELQDSISDAREMLDDEDSTPAFSVFERGSILFVISNPTKSNPSLTIIKKAGDKNASISFHSVEDDDTVLQDLVEKKKNTEWKISLMDFKEVKA